MLQRIQSVYLFIAFLLIGSMLLFPLADILINNKLYEFTYRGILFIDSENTEIIINTIPVSILIAVISLISLLTIFLYKKRMLQIRIGIFNIILMIGLYGLMYFYLYQSINEFDTKIHYSFPIIFPVISIILTILANKFIRKDENLVRSYDRIR